MTSPKYPPLNSRYLQQKAFPARTNTTAAETAARTALFDTLVIVSYMGPTSKMREIVAVVEIPRKSQKY